MLRGCAALRAITGKRALEEPRLDQLFAEPIVKQLMDRYRIDEATIRRLLRQTAVARATPSLMTMRMTLPDAATRAAMLATGMEGGMEASYARLDRMK